jgi:hypothetical protein
LRQHPRPARINMVSADKLVDSRHSSPITSTFVRVVEVDPR